MKYAAVIPSLSRDLYAKVVIIFIEILRLRFAPLRMTKDTVFGSPFYAPLRRAGGVAEEGEFLPVL